MVYLSCLVLFLFSLRLLISGTKVNKNATARNLVNARKQAQKRVKWKRWLEKMRDAASRQWSIVLSAVSLRSTGWNARLSMA